jgi:TonB family protein
MDGDWLSEDAHRPSKDAHRASKCAHDGPKGSHSASKDTHRALNDAHWPSKDTHRASNDAHWVSENAHRASKNGSRASNDTDWPSRCAHRPAIEAALWRTAGFRTSIYPMRLLRLLFAIPAISSATMSVRLGAQGTSCAETKYPLELPQPSALVDSAHAMEDLAAFAGPKPMVFSVVFQQGDSVAQVRALDKNDAAAAVSLANYVRHAPPGDLWAVRVRIAGGDAPALTLQRSIYCPPVLLGGEWRVITGAVGQVGALNPMPPDLALSQTTADTMPVEALVSADGRIVTARVLQPSGNSATDARAVTQLKQRKFQPAKLDGQPIQGVYRSNGQSPRP